MPPSMLLVIPLGLLLVSISAVLLVLRRSIA
jgi:hypothetical protein